MAGGGDFFQFLSLVICSFGEYRQAFNFLTGLIRSLYHLQGSLLCFNVHGSDVVFIIASMISCHWCRFTECSPSLGPAASCTLLIHEWFIGYHPAVVIMCFEYLYCCSSTSTTLLVSVCMYSNQSPI